jgi:hypothetical protein
MIVLAKRRAYFPPASFYKCPDSSPYNTHLALEKPQDQKAAFVLLNRVLPGRGSSEKHQRRGTFSRLFLTD